MKRRYTVSGVQQYLESTGILQHGSADDIALAKKEYWQAVKRRWKAEKRKNSFTVIYSDAELRKIQSYSQKVGISRTRYIKQASLREFTFPNIGQLRELLMQNYSLILELCRECVLPETLGDSLLRRMDTLERDVINTLIHPKPLIDDY